jgi:P27 family predicted phage terminase small subunit
MAVQALNVSRLRPPPPHLGPEGRKLWIETVATYAVDTEAALATLAVAAQALDRLAECRDTIKAEGLTLQDRHGRSYSNPLLKIEASARQSFAAAMRALRLAPSTSKNK